MLVRFGPVVTGYQTFKMKLMNSNLITGVCLLLP